MDFRFVADTEQKVRAVLTGSHFSWSYRKYNFPYILVRHKKYQAATGVLKDLAPAKYFFSLIESITSHTFS